MSEKNDHSLENLTGKLILSWVAEVPEGYKVVACDDSTHTMVVVPLTSERDLAIG
jgi:hypothetical protein